MKKRLFCCLLAAVILLGSVAILSPRSRAADNMTASAQLIEILKKIEGFAPRPYWDYSQWTVGYGTRCPNEMLEEYSNRDITEAEAEALLQQMLKDFENEVNKLIQKHGLSLTQYEFDALVTFTYNCGGAWTYNENSAMNRAVRYGFSGTDLVHTMSLYSMADTDYILIDRRLSEACLYLEGQYEAYNTSSDGTYPYRYRYVYLDGNGGEVLYDIHGYTAADPKAPKATFTRIPTGVDGSGNPFIYSFAGWYTAPTGGTKVETLDGSLPSGTVLYAQWADPNGQIVALPKGTKVENVTATVHSSIPVNVRTGPGTFYSKTSQLADGTVITVTEFYDDGDLLWGKFDGGWACLNYTDFVAPAAPQQPGITDVSLLAAPANAVCIQGQQPADLSGSVIKITYSDGTIGARTLHTDMITSCDTKNLGEITVSCSYGGYSVSFPMTVEKATITFCGSDGTVLSQKQYALGETVEVPEMPAQDGEYLFAGWSAQVIPCNGNRTYTAIYALPTPPEPSVPETTGPSGTTDPAPSEPEPTEPTPPPPPEVPQWPRTGIITNNQINVRTGPGTNHNQAGYQLNSGNLVVIQEVVYDGSAYNWGRMENGHWVCMDYVKLLSVETTSLPGDTNGDSMVNKDDAIYLLLHIYFPEDHPLTIDGDMNADNVVDKDDAIYLLLHVYFPEDHPLIYG